MAEVSSPVSDEDSSGPSLRLFGATSPAGSEEQEESPNGDDDNSSLGGGDELLAHEQLTKSFTHLSTTSGPNSPVEFNKNNEQEEDNDDGESSEEESRKKVRVGNHYQARIPKLSVSGEIFEDKTDDEQLWDPYRLDASTVDSFLATVSALTKNALPMGKHVKDDEEALYALHQNDHDPAYTLDQLRHKRALAASQPRSGGWSEEECRSFEKGFVRFGKNFYMIQKRNLAAKPVAELVQFYYLWKKSERYDLYASRIRAGKKKYCINPGIPDLTHKYLHLGSVKAAAAANGLATHDNVQYILKNEAKKKSVSDDSQY